MKQDVLRISLFIILFILLPVIGIAQEGQKTLSELNLQGFEQKQDDGMVWKNNPFVRPANEVAASELKLTGIVWSPQKNAVIINDEVLSVGDKIGFNELVGIEPTHVILRNENGLFSLALKGGK